MIGLKRHTVRLVEHREEWAGCFDAECSLLQSEIGDIVAKIEHVGSTAVPDLVAKPIIDIAVGIESMSVIEDIVSRLARHQYTDCGDGLGGYLLVKQSLPDIRTVHLHIVEIADPRWSDYLTFRDVLRGDHPLRQQYSELKRHLAQKYSDDRESYTAGKHEFIMAALAAHTEEHPVAGTASPTPPGPPASAGSSPHA